MYIAYFMSQFSIMSLCSFSPLVFNSPSITPDTNLLIITEGDSTTLTCIRDSTNSNSDQYRWTRPDGSFSPPQTASSPIDLILSTINRNQSGLYVCTGTRPGTSETVNATITINVECNCNLSETLNYGYALLEVTYTNFIVYSF